MQDHVRKHSRRFRHLPVRIGYRRVLPASLCEYHGVQISFVIECSLMLTVADCKICGKGSNPCLTQLSEERPSQSAHRRDSTSHLHDHLWDEQRIPMEAATFLRRTL